MKKRLLSCALALCMMYALCACGGPGRNTALPNPPPAEVLTPPEGSQSSDVNESDGDYVEEPVEPGPEPEPAKPEGLVFLSVGQNTLDIFCFNPETKEETPLASFTIPSEQNQTFYSLPIGQAVHNRFYRGLFSSDYSKMAINIGFRNSNDRHTGWIDTDGTIFDIVEAFGLQSKSDFDTPVEFYAEGFAGEMFNYRQSPRNESGLAGLYGSLYYVPVDNAVPNAVYEGNYYSEKGQYNDYGFFNSIPGESINGKKYWPERITSWIDDTHCIVNVGEPYSDKYNSPQSLILDIETFKTMKYIPGDTRWNWNGVISPDGTRIAFMSSLKDDIYHKNNNSIDIYITARENGEPEKVTDLPYELGSVAFCLDGPSYTHNEYQGIILIDWI